MKSIFHFSLLLLLSAVAVRAALIPVPLPIDCSAVSCLRPLCEPGQILQTPQGECCPKCVPDCSAVLCENLEGRCRIGEILLTPDGECCPICHQNCAVVLCARPICEEGEELFTPRGKCCPICRRPEEPECEVPGQVFSTCASPCKKTCETPNPPCLPFCLSGCTCPPGQVIDETINRCVPVEDCPTDEPQCPIKGQTFSTCARCDSTCDEINSGNPRRCPAVCRPGCSCPAGQSIDTVKGACVDTDECPKSVDPCASKTCPRGSSCEVFRPTGEAFCQPSCDIDNGGCTADQTCELVPVICVRAPCPPEVKCTDPDPCDQCPKGTVCDVQVGQCLVPPCPTSVRCLDPEQVCSLPSETGPCEALFRRYFHNNAIGRCEQFIYGGCQGNENNFETKEACETTCDVDPCASKTCSRGSSCEVYRRTRETFCLPSCDIDNGGCSSDQVCRLEEVQCVRAPCPPEVRCKPRDLCATVRCANGFRCKVFTPIPFGDEFNEEPQAFCDPDCSLNNGGCPLDKQCQLLPTPCAFNTPCPYARLCVDPPTEAPTKPPTCPPTCSKEFCSMRGNRRALCSNPGPRELPGCTGSCQLSYCSACYFSEEPISPTPGNCTECEPSEYASNTRCYRRWAKCVGRAHTQAFGRPSRDDKTEENFRCYRPPCPFKG